MDYLYDGTFSGFLTVVATARRAGTSPMAICRVAPDQQALFSPLVRVTTEPELAAQQGDELAAILSPAGRRLIHAAFLSAAPGVELRLWHYLELARRVGPAIGSMLTHEQVQPVWELARAVGREAHRFKGFVRFRQLAGGYHYAAIAPDYRILPLIAPHFAARFADQQWLIHDERRSEAVVYDPVPQQWLIVPLEVRAPLCDTADEQLFRSLWQCYFDRLAIAERHNPRLQQQHVPRKHRRHLPEFDKR
ncbi:hypothetical protein GURASL_37180 [Geotalea uraniireducens]|uniref:DUF4130 domain-containing protein n=1 Tax=Geotalea uraniireducens TaxID=351604 RepID=A0ABM8EQA1_9BACT|nr:TIGR03915 family putative DNA repair protein [Geotalea uraniireducens]BDV44795.1 hypothetical protein GURASL_37180 [Geotalea uraniireducens]